MSIIIHFINHLKNSVPFENSVHTWNFTEEFQFPTSKSHPPATRRSSKLTTPPSIENFTTTPTHRLNLFRTALKFKFLPKQATFNVLLSLCNIRDYFSFETITWKRIQKGAFNVFQLVMFQEGT